MSLEDLSFEQRDELAMLAKQLADNPETRENFLRLTKQVKPDLTIPELALKDDLARQLKVSQDSYQKLEAKFKQKEQMENLQELRNRLVEDGKASKADIPAIEKLMAVEYGADFIALSYVKCASDAQELCDYVHAVNPRIGICAKIEMRQGIHDLHHILKVVDVVMVARGDMGLQMDIEDVPLMQKRIIHACSTACKPVITATQMLESMIHNPRPTRAEATDVANAILDGTDAVMLSGETASGQYPIECVLTMSKIAERTETMYDHSRINRDFEDRHSNGISRTDAIAHSVSDLAKCLRPQAILTTTTSGQTPRLVSKFRPKEAILCATWDEVTQRQLSIVWGVETLKISPPETTESTIREAIDEFSRLKRLKLGELVIITAGVPPGTPGNTNMILTQMV